MKCLNFFTTSFFQSFAFIFLHRKKHMAPFMFNVMLTEIHIFYKGGGKEKEIFFIKKFRWHLFFNLQFWDIFVVQWSPTKWTENVWTFLWRHSHIFFADSFRWEADIFLLTVLSPIAVDLFPTNSTRVKYDRGVDVVVVVVVVVAVFVVSRSRWHVDTCEPPSVIDRGRRTGTCRSGNGFASRCGRTRWPDRTPSARTFRSRPRWWSPSSGAAGDGPRPC